MATPNLLAARQERCEQLRRARATALRLRTEFPTVTQLRIDLSFEAERSRTPGAQAHVLYPPAPAFFVYQCPYADCDGEFNLDGAVHRAMEQGHHTEVGLLECGGTRPIERGAKRACGLKLAYAIAAVLGDIS